MEFLVILITPTSSTDKSLATNFRTTKVKLSCGEPYIGIHLIHYKQIIRMDN